jgi:hypothetical protein
VNVEDFVIKVVGPTACAEAVVEQDPWIILKITWLPRPSAQPLYLRISGEQGGELELKVDPVSGTLLQVVVIDPPPATMDVPNSDNWTSREECLVPLIDLSQWMTSELENAPLIDMGGEVISISTSLGFWSTGSRTGISFGNHASARYLVCGRVRVGISCNGHLAEIDCILQ